jgi:hypothetical protein
MLKTRSQIKEALEVLQDEAWERGINIEFAEVLKMLEGEEPQTETPAYTLFRHITDGGAEYLTDNHMFADAKIVIRLDGGAELVTCEGMKARAPEVQSNTALAARLEDGVSADIWFEDFYGTEHALNAQIERTQNAMIEAAAILRGEPAKAPGSVDTSVCPKCGSFEIEGEAVEIENSYADQSVSCVVCDASWIDTYTATSREILDHRTGAKE